MGQAPMWSPVACPQRKFSISVQKRVGQLSGMVSIRRDYVSSPGRLNTKYCVPAEKFLFLGHEGWVNPSDGFVNIWDGFKKRRLCQSTGRLKRNYRVGAENFLFLCHER